MVYKKEFWFAVFLFIAFAFVIGDLVRNGFATYRITAIVLFPLFGVAFMKRALKR